MPPAGFESAVPASERLQSNDLDRAATGMGSLLAINRNNNLTTTLRTKINQQNAQINSGLICAFCWFIVYFCPHY